MHPCIVLTARAACHGASPAVHERVEFVVLTCSAAHRSMNGCAIFPGRSALSCSPIRTVKPEDGLFARPNKGLAISCLGEDQTLDRLPYREPGKSKYACWLLSRHRPRLNSPKAVSPRQSMSARGPVAAPSLARPALLARRSLADSRPRSLARRAPRSGCPDRPQRASEMSPGSRPRNPRRFVWRFCCFAVP